MKPLPRRLPSKSAKWALRVSIFAPILAVISLLAHKSGNLDTPTFIVLMAVVAAIAAFSLFLIIVAFRSLWVHGKRGGRRATWAFLLSSVVLAPFVYGGGLWFSSPRVAEVSTDLADPPVTGGELLEFSDKAPAMIAATLVDAYPEVTGRRYNATQEIVYDRILKLAEARGWETDARRGRVGADVDLIGEFTELSMILAMQRKIIIRVRDEGDTTYVDMRSRSEFVNHDLGSNAKLIGSFMSELDFTLIGQSE